AVVLAGTFAMTPLLKTNFLGDTGQNTVTVTQALEPDAALAAQDKAATAVEHVLLGIDGVETVQPTVGSGEGVASSFGGGPDASFSITTGPAADQVALQDEIRDATGALEDVGTVTLDSSGGFGGGAVEVVVTADDSETLDEAADIVLEAVKG